MLCLGLISAQWCSPQPQQKIYRPSAASGGTEIFVLALFYRITDSLVCSNFTFTERSEADVGFATLLLLTQILKTSLEIYKFGGGFLFCLFFPIFKEDLFRNAFSAGGCTRHRTGTLSPFLCFSHQIPLVVLEWIFFQ